MSKTSNTEWLDVETKTEVLPQALPSDPVESVTQGRLLVAQQGLASLRMEHQQTVLDLDAARERITELHAENIRLERALAKAKPIKRVWSVGFKRVWLSVALLVGGLVGLILILAGVAAILPAGPK